MSTETTSASDTAIHGLRIVAIADFMDDPPHLPPGSQASWARGTWSTRKASAPPTR